MYGILAFRATVSHDDQNLKGGFVMNNHVIDMNVINGIMTFVIHDIINNSIVINAMF